METILYLSCVTAAVLFGWLTGRRLRTRLEGALGTVLGRMGTVVVCFGIWLLASLTARAYSETAHPVWWLAEGFAHTGKWYVFIAGTVALMTCAAHASRQAAARTSSRWLIVAAIVLICVAICRSFPVYILLHEGRRDEQGYLIQSVDYEYACGPVVLGNYLERYHNRPPFSERELARVCGTTIEGTPRWKLMCAARQLGVARMECLALTADDLHARESPSIISISTLPGLRHATLYIRRDAEFAYCIDPAYGLWKTSLANFDRILYGKSVVFDP